MIRKRPLTLDEFKNIFSKVPRVTVDLVIKNESGILLTLRSKDGWVGKWHLPGGSVTYQESAEEAVHRVSVEELGVEVKIERMIGYIEYLSEAVERGFGHSVALVFLCTPLSDKIILDDGASEYQFFKVFPEKLVMEQKEFLNKLELV